MLNEVSSSKWVEIELVGMVLEVVLKVRMMVMEVVMVVIEVMIVVAYLKAPAIIVFTIGLQEVIMQNEGGELAS